MQAGKAYLYASALELHPTKDRAPRMGMRIAGGFTRTKSTPASGDDLNSVAYISACPTVAPAFEVY